MGDAIEVVRGVVIKRSDPRRPPYLATLVLPDGSHLCVQVEEAAVTAVNEVVMLTRVMGGLACVELRGQTLARAWTES